MNMCLQAYKGAIRPPSANKIDTFEQKKIPQVQLEIQHVYGYRVKDMRNNLWITKSGQLLYCAASLAIVHDIETNTQKFFTEMDDDVIAMDMARDGTKAAVGEVGKSPQICIFDCDTLQQLNQFQGVIQRGVHLLSFCPSGNKLAAIGRNDDHSIVIYDTTDKVSVGGYMMIEQFSGKTALTACQWINNKELVTVGPNHVMFWALGRDQLQFLQLVGQKVKYPVKEDNILSQMDKIVMCLAINQHTQDDYEFLAGDISGCLQIFQHNEIISYRKLHQRALQALQWGNDGQVKILDKHYNTLSVIDKSYFGASIWGKIRAIVMEEHLHKFYIGTHGAEIFEVQMLSDTLDKNTKYKSKLFLGAHYSPNHSTNNQVWGLCIYPTKPDIFLTCSDDCTIRFWDSKKRQMIKRISTNVDQFGGYVQKDFQQNDYVEESQSKSIACHPEGKMIAVGSRTGQLRIFTGEGAFMNEYQIAEEEIGDIQFSPNGEFLAAASNDQTIYIINIDDFKYVRKLFKHSSSVRAISFSVDGTYLQSTCQSGELLYWDLTQFKQDTFGGTQMRDEKWTEWNHCVGWSVQGIYRKGYSGLDINCCDRSHNMVTRYAPHDYYLIACGDDDSQVNLFRYPSVSAQEAYAVSKKAHSSHVTNLQFNLTDDLLFSTGGEDQCVIQWRIKQNVSVKPPETKFVSQSEREKNVFKNCYGGVKQYS